MNYYEHHIGDYAAATGHLSLIEDAIYSRLLRRYYMQEGPLPPPVDQCARLIGARGEEEIVKAILLEFFRLSDDGWHQKRADEDIERYRVKVEKKRASAVARWEGQSVKSECERIATDALDTRELHNGRNALQTPDTSLQTPVKAKTPVVPFGDAQAVIGAYHSALPKCQSVAVLNPKRKRRIAEAVKLARQVCVGQGWDYIAEDFWAAYFAECATDPWMRGEVPNPKNPHWRQNLDVLLAEDRFAGIMDRAIASMRRVA